MNLETARATSLGEGHLSRAFRARGIENLGQALDWVKDLPYGRNSSPHDAPLVVTEQRGTCSTKHAILARLALEIGVPAELRMALFEMNEANTPGVGATLAEAGLDAMLEAHCLMDLAGVQVDVTGLAQGEAAPVYLSFRTLDPLGLADKAPMHRIALDDWLREREQGMPLDAAWDVRERCIAALGAGSPSTISRPN